MPHELPGLAVVVRAERQSQERGWEHVQSYKVDDQTAEVCVIHANARACGSIAMENCEYPGKGKAVYCAYA